MSLEHAGWLEGRSFAIIRDEEGTPVKFIDLRTRYETEADVDVFCGINWVEIENRSKVIIPIPLAGERRPEQPSTVSRPDKFEGIDWGSGKAAELAADAGLVFEDFVGREPGGAKGFNADDVKEIIAEKAEEEEE